ncbi:5751_t:CDS:1, partial [Racocetra persica]
GVVMVKGLFVLASQWLAVREQETMQGLSFRLAVAVVLQRPFAAE